MSGLFTASRPLTVKSPAIPLISGEPALVPVKLQGTEGINSLFHYTLTLQTPDALNYMGATGANFDLETFIGLELTCSIELEGHGQFRQGLPGAGLANQGAGVREISGLISAARLVTQTDRHAIYEIEIRPWLHIATLGTNCRVYQNMTPVQVIEAMLTNYHFAAEKRLIASYPKRDYCVQYNETNFEFITRLMQEWGISYWFEHSAGVHRLIWADHNGAYQATQKKLTKGLSAYHQIPYYPLGHKIDREYIHNFQTTHHITSGVYTTRDYDYTRPRATLQASSSAPRNTGQNQEEVYLWRSAKSGFGGSDYSQPLAGADRTMATSSSSGSDKEANQTDEQGRQLAMLRMQHLRQAGARASGTGHVRGIVPGCTFTLTEHPQQAANTEYIVLNTRFLIENVNEETQRNAVAALSDAQRLTGQWRVVVDFDVQPTQEILRPAITQPKPTIYGVHNALVCGPNPETTEANLYTEYLGRVKLQFMWDRYGTQDNNSSCWVRVASSWAGNQLGGIHLPRVGQEVVVGFYDGDPDLPIVIGSVHNQLNQPPWSLPSQQALSGFRSRELVSGGGNSAGGRSNHVLLDDTAGKIQAQLKSDHQHSQLSLGHITRVEDNQGRKDYRGEGFDLRTDGHGAIRAKDGLHITTYGRVAANEHLLSMQETTDQLGAGLENHKSMGNLAVHHLAQTQDEADAVQQSLQQQADDVSGNGHTRTEGTFPEMQAAHLTLSSPAGIESTTQGSTHHNSEQHHAITAGQHISLAGAGSLLASAGKNIGMLANKAMRLIAAKGKAQIQAQDNDLELLAQRVVEILGRQGVVIKSDALIRLMVGQHAIQLTPAGGIEFLSPMSPQFHTAAVNLGNSKTSSMHMQESPNSSFNDPYILKNQRTGEPLGNMKVKVIREDGTELVATSGSDGRLAELKSLIRADTRAKHQAD